MSNVVGSLGIVVQPAILVRVQCLLRIDSSWFALDHSVHEMLSNTDHVLRRHAAYSVDKPADDIPSAIQFGNRAQLPMIEVAMRRDAVHEPANPPIAPIDLIRHYVEVREVHRQQIALHIIGSVVVAPASVQLETSP